MVQRNDKLFAKRVDWLLDVMKRCVDSRGCCDDCPLFNRCYNSGRLVVVDCAIEVIEEFRERLEEAQAAADFDVDDVLGFVAGIHESFERLADLEDRVADLEDQTEEISTAVDTLYEIHPCLDDLLL